jgi:hypothetical protein
VQVAAPRFAIAVRSPLVRRRDRDSMGEARGSLDAAIEFSSYVVGPASTGFDRTADMKIDDLKRRLPSGCARQRNARDGKADVSLGGQKTTAQGLGFRARFV